MPTSDSLNTGILEILWSAGPIAKVVLGILLLFSIISWALIVEKWWQFRRVRRQSIGFVKIFREGRRPSIVHAAARKYRDSPLAQLYAAAYTEVSGVPDVIDQVIEDGDEGLPPDRLDAVHRAMRRSAGLEVAQLERYLPFLATTKLLVAAARRGVGREVAHEAIREHAVAVALAMREQGAAGNDLFDRLAADPRLGLTREEIGALVADRGAFAGAASAQVAAVARQVAAVVAAHPEAGKYVPAPIL